MTSHEMRNPLSVIFQCAEAIVSSLTWSDSLDSVPEKPLLLSPKLNESIKEALEAARTINVCAQHQKVGPYYYPPLPAFH
jgi:hypothetical protein